jgi:flagellar motor switch protein FliN/FliY
VETKPSTAENQSRRLDLLLDVPLDVSVELGRRRMSIQELLALGPGAVIELDKLAGEPLDILVNDRLIARGEVVVVNDKFGIRITDIVNRTERIARLR